MASRHIMRIELTPGAKTHLATMSERHGMTQVALMSRLTEWFSSESELIQSAVIGRYPAELEADIAKLILKEMSKNADSEAKVSKKKS